MIYPKTVTVVGANGTMGANVSAILHPLGMPGCTWLAETKRSQRKRPSSPLSQ